MSGSICWIHGCIAIPTSVRVKPKRRSRGADELRGDSAALDGRTWRGRFQADLEHGASLAACAAILEDDAVAFVEDDADAFVEDDLPGDSEAVGGRTWLGRFQADHEHGAPLAALMPILEDDAEPILEDAADAFVEETKQPGCSRVAPAASSMQSVGERTLAAFVPYDEGVRIWRRDCTWRKRRRCERPSKTVHIVRPICAKLYEAAPGNNVVYEKEYNQVQMEEYEEELDEDTALGNSVVYEKEYNQVQMEEYGEELDETTALEIAIAESLQELVIDIEGGDFEGHGTAVEAARTTLPDCCQRHERSFMK
jgi:hypothetical protein